MSERTGIFAGDDPFALAQSWLEASTDTEINDPNAIALATADEDGLPNVRMVLLKEITSESFVFYTNYEGKKGQEIEASGKAALVWHAKSLGRQIRVRGLARRVPEATSDAYFSSRSLQSRIGAWASQQSRPLASRASLMADVAKMTVKQGPNPKRPPHWGGYEIVPQEIEFWADGAFRLHDRFQWKRRNVKEAWTILRLHP